MKDAPYIAACIIFALAIWSGVIWIKVNAWQDCREHNSWAFCFVAIGGR